MDICNLQGSNIECYGNFDFFILLFLFYIRYIRYDILYISCGNIF